MRLSPAPDPKTASTAIGPANGDHARPGAIQAAFAAAKSSCSSGVTTTLSALSVSIVVLVLVLQASGVVDRHAYQTIRARSSSLDSPMPSGAAPQQPRLPRAKWTTQSDFLEQCSDFDPEEPIPADHPSQLAPLFAHPADQPIDTRLLFQQLEVAINGTEAMKNGSASWPKPLSCLQEPPNPGLLAVERPKIGIVVAYSNNSATYENASSIYMRSLEDKRQYAARHGYHVVEFDNVAAEHKRPLASVYSRLLGALSVIRMFDWIWIVDLDTIVMNPDVRLESFLDNRFDFITGIDCNGVNAGSVFLRNTTWSVFLLLELYMHNAEGINPEQWQVFPENAVLIERSLNHCVRNHIKVVHQRRFNSYGFMGACGGGAQFKSGDFLVHFPGPQGKPFFDHFWSLREKEWARSKGTGS
ncbi:hypothetical protein ABPG77_009004 [Micractinium sp. CCAP 211/92]